jgi:putative ABC transport system permease protein
VKYLPLVWSALCRRRARTLLTLLSVSTAFFLFGVLDTVRGTFVGAGRSVAGLDRIVVTPKTGMMSKPLPYSLLSLIQEVPGAVDVEYASYVAGTYQDPKNSFVVEAHPAGFFRKSFFPEVDVAPVDLKALQSTRAGVLAGEALAKKYGLKVGQKIPLQTQQMRKDGSTVWIFDLVGILHFTDPNLKVFEEQLFGNWDYVDAARIEGAGTVAYFTVKASSISDVDRIARQIDNLTANSSYETKSQPEGQWARAEFQQFGDIGLIVTSIMGAVYFTLLLLTGHTMMHAVHERIPELAVLKTVGFTGRQVLGLVLCESLALMIFGAVLGLALGMIAVLGVRTVDVMPITILPLNAQVWMRGLTLAILIGLVVGIVPARRGMRLRIVEALSH